MNYWVIIAFLITMVVVLLSLIKFRLHPIVVMFCAAILMGLLSGMPIASLLDSISTGVGSTMASLGLVVAFGSVFGAALAASGATEELAKGLLRTVGVKNDLLALNLAGFIVSIPVYFASGYIMLSPLLNSLQELTQKKMKGYVAALFGGLLLAHCVVAPTPGPVAVAAQIGANLGWFIVYGILVGLPASLLCWAMGRFIYGKPSKEESEQIRARAQDILQNKELLAHDPSKPTALMALGLIMFPILLIVAGAVADMALPEGSILGLVLAFLGNNNVALFLGMMVSLVALRKYLIPGTAKSLYQCLEDSANTTGSMLLLLAVGGSFGQVIGTSGLGTVLVTVMSQMNMPIILLAFLLSLILRAAIGSGTVAMLTAVSVIGPVAIEMGYSPVIVGLAICMGSAGLTIPTDGAFWLPTRYNGLSIKECFSTLTVSHTLASLLGLGLLLVLNTFAQSLPGMF